MAESNGDVMAKVMGIIAKQAGVGTEQIAPETHLITDLSFDSLDVMETVMEVEDQFGITVEEEAVQKLGTVLQIAEYVQERQKTAGAQS